MPFNNEYKNRFRILKGGLISLVVASNLYGAPSGGTVVSGNATISQNANTTNINQSSNKAIINWQDFSIKSNETVNFNQPNVNSITLNRVIGNEKSIIDGALNANGQVWLINSNGVLFGKNAKVNTAGIVVSTKDISNEDFNKGNYNFKGNSTSSIVNEGEIKSLANTHATFIANSVTNKGKIEVHKGTINLVGASDVTLTLNENQNISLKVNKGVLDALVDNQNLIVANGGQIYLTTNAKDELLKGVVNNSGIIEANSLDDLQSEVIIFAHGGTANISGEIKAKDSFVETSGKDLNITNEAKITAKKWLLDPVNVTIDASNGTIGNETVGATVIQTALNNNTDIEIQADNNINVNEAITWSTDKQLKLQADNINVNATINNTNSTNGGVYFQAANTTDTVVFGTDGKVIVNNLYQLQWINQALNGKYELGSNIDAGATSSWNSNGSGGYYGFNPIGNSTNLFTGTFDGLGFTISNLYINRPSQNNIGLFGYTNNATIKNIGLKDVDIRGYYYVGGLVGVNENGTISNSYATGSVSGNEYAGGLVGYCWYGTISNSYASGNVNGTDTIGGLVGYNYKGTITNSYASGSVTGQNDVGGLVGYNWYGTITNSYATGTVGGHSGGGFYVGGLVGWNDAGTILTSFYDNETNTASMDDSSYGKTKEQIATALKSASSEWETDLSKGRGYGTDGTTALPFLKNVTKLSNTLFEDGFGTTLNPYKITNWTQLQNINNSNILTKNYYFNLLNNLSSSTSDYTNLASNTANVGLGWNPIGDNTNRFTGTFDGLGFTISDLYINRPYQNYVGLFGYINSSSTVKNIGLTNVDITGQTIVGGLAGENYGTISNSYATGSVNGDYNIGGLVGYNDGTISNSYASGNVNGTDTIGGLVGYNWYGTISNSYASGNVNGTDTIGGLVGYNWYGTITNSFYDKEVNSLTSMSDISLGKTKAEILSSFSGKTGWGTTGGGDSASGYEILLLPYLIGVTKDEDKSKSILFSGGFGTEVSPYTITNWTQLQNINNSNVVGSSYYFSLLNNINSSTTGYMGNSGEGWNPIGNSSNSFTGTFDGLGFTISNLYIKRPTQSYVGLFGYINSGSTIKNIGLKDLDITGNYHVGGLIGNNYGTISNSYASGTVSGTSSYVGGLVGDNYAGAISNSYATGTVSGGSYVGGLVGSNGGTISNSYSTGTISGNNNVGGLSGYNVLTISNSFYDKEANSLVSMSDSSLGKTKAEILSAFSGKSGWGTTGAGDSVEGYETVLLPYLIGVTKDEDKSKSILFSGGFGTEVSPYTITNWTQLQNINNSNILTQNYYFNLLNNLSSSTSDYTNLASNTANSGLGWNTIGNNTNRFNGTFDGKDFTISNLYINRPTQNHVGLFGFTNNATIKNIGVVDFEIYALGYSGGLAGSADNNTQISNSYSTGGIYAYTDFGGLIGHLINSSSIEYSYSLANINKRELSSGLLRAGGLVGTVQTSSSVKNSYSIGNITGGNSNDNEVGGLIGYLHGSEVLNSYSSRNINASGTTLIGGLIGKNSGTIQYSFYDNTKFSGDGVGSSSQTGVTGLTIEEMSYGKIFKDANWDIVADSSINQATPVIKYDSVNNKYFWAISPIALTYTLSDKTTTYDGTTQTLSSFYTSNPFTIPTGYNFLNLTSTDYKFQKDGSDVTGYKDAGTYSNIKVALNGTSATDEFLTISSSGNTDGNLVINKANATITANSDSKVYNGLVQNVNGFTVIGLVNNEDKSVLIGITGDTASGKDVGVYNTALAGTDTNYNLTFVNGALTITSVPTPNPTPTDNNQKPKVDEKVQRVIASIEPSTNSNSSSNQSVPNSLNSNIRTLSFSGVDETRVINGGVRVPDDIVNSLDEL